jgi:hypothetical protein
MKITFLQSGGFAGMLKGCTIDAADLAPGERLELESLVVASGLSESLERFSSTGRDLRQYEIVIERDARVQRIVCDDRSVPEAVRPLVAFLSARARPQPAGDTEHASARLSAETSIDRRDQPLE